MWSEGWTHLSYYHVMIQNASDISSSTDNLSDLLWFILTSHMQSDEHNCTEMCNWIGPIVVNTGLQKSRANVGLHWSTQTWWADRSSKSLVLLCLLQFLCCPGWDPKAQVRSGSSEDLIMSSRKKTARDLGNDSASESVECVGELTFRPPVLCQHMWVCQTYILWRWSYLLLISHSITISSWLSWGFWAQRHLTIFTRSPTNCSFWPGSCLFHSGCIKDICCHTSSCNRGEWQLYCRMEVTLSTYHFLYEINGFNDLQFQDIYIQ